MKIVFMGTPDFAVASLAALCDNGYTPIAAICQPDKPKGRGFKMIPPAVKVYAESKSIPVYQPSTLRGEEFATLLSELDPDMIVVASYGKILPPNVISYPKYGCINVHGSLLPAYRGAAPIQRAIMDGDRTTGITTMLMDDGLDTGDMLLVESTDITEEDNFESLHDRLAAIGGELLVKTINGILDGTVKPVPQPIEGATYAQKIQKEECHISFDDSVRNVFNIVRGLSPIPLAYALLPNGERMKIVRATVLSENADDIRAGEVLALSSKGEGSIDVTCRDGVLRIAEVIPEGKGRMSAAAFVCGRKIAVGDILV